MSCESQQQRASKLIPINLDSLFRESREWNVLLELTLDQEIDELRIRLSELATECKNNLQDPMVIALSQQLDTLILQYIEGVKS